jgi:hypothetical protein
MGSGLELLVFLEFMEVCIDELRELSNSIEELKKEGC